MAEWYYTVRGRQRGPVADDELRDMAASGELKRTDLVWKEGMADWVEAGDAPGLFPGDDHELAGRAGKRRPRPADAPDEDYADDDFDDRPRRRQRKGLGTGAWIAIIGGVVGALVLAAVLILFLTLGGSSSSALDRNETLTRADPLDTVRVGSHRKVYTVRMEAGRTYTIDMMSNAFDSFLRLEDASTGQNLAMDDDGGERLNSRIHFRAFRTGDYRVIATTLGPGQVGPFRVTVREGAHHRNP